MQSMTKYIFVTGGVVSSLGKGITAASLGVLLKRRGYKVSIIKMVKLRLEREVQEYPEIGYSLQERNTLGDVISSEIGNLIAGMLPGENENEQ